MTTEAKMYVYLAIAFQVLLIIHFALRKWAFDAYIYRWGWLFYLMAVPAAVVSVVLIRRGAPWWMWLGGLLYLVWAVFGYLVEFRFGVRWRDPIVWPVFAPYILLYLGTTMFYWWPLANISKPLWWAAAVLFAFGTVLNVISH